MAGGRGSNGVIGVQQAPPTLQNPNGTSTVMQTAPSAPTGPAGPTPEQLAAEEARKAQVLYAGTPYETTVGQVESTMTPGAPVADPRGYMFGRDPNAANDAVNKAYGIGDAAYATGQGILGQDTSLADAARNRAAPVGDFGQQNLALNQSMLYGGNLAGLEAQQGPSAAQAQLQAGTNQGLAQQLALARSGRGFGGGSAAMGLAQGNMAGIAANGANQSSMLAAQEQAAWRQRQAANLQTAAGINQGAGSQFGGQAQANMNAYLQNQGMGDQASLGYLGQGATAYGQGAAQSLQGQGVANQVRGMEMSGGQALDDRALRAWAAKQGYDLAQRQADAQQTAALVGGVATVGGAIVGGMFGGPGGAAVGGAAGNAGARALTS